MNLDSTNTKASKRFFMKKVISAIKILFFALVIALLIVIYQGYSYNKQIDINRFNAIEEWAKEHNQLELGESIQSKCFNNDDGFKEIRNCVAEFDNESLKEATAKAAKEAEMPWLLNWVMIELPKMISDKEVSIK